MPIIMPHGCGMTIPHLDFNVEMNKRSKIQNFPPRPRGIVGDFHLPNTPTFKQIGFHPLTPHGLLSPRDGNQMCLAMVALFQACMDLNPSPPSCFGAQRCSQETFAPDFLISGPVQKKDLRMDSISLITLLGRINKED